MTRSTARRACGWARSPALLGTLCLISVLVASLTSGAGAARSRVAAVVSPLQTWVTDGSVLAMTSVGGSTYVGGDFGLIGRATGSWAHVDAAGSVRAIRAVVRGEIERAEPDGRGGWFLLGDVDSVGGVEVKRGELVHVGAGGRLDPRFEVRANDSIRTIARVGRRLYVGGSFEQLNGEPRAAVAALDVVSGALLDWRPRVTARKRDGYASVDALAVTRDGRTVYVAGDFGRVNGVPRSSLAAIAAEGTLLRFAPALRYADEDDDEAEASEESASVSLITPDPQGRAVYVAGFFNEVGGEPRPGLAAVDARTGKPRTWNPDCDGDVSSIIVAPAGSPIYLAGEFASVGGRSRRGLAAVDARAGTATLWDPGIGGSVSAIALDARRKVIYAGGEFQAVGEADRANLAAVDTRTGRATEWDVPVIGTVETLAPSAGGGVAVGGSYASRRSRPARGARDADRRRRGAR